MSTKSRQGQECIQYGRVCDAENEVEQGDPTSVWAPEEAERPPPPIVQPQARRTDIDGLRSVAVLGVIIFHMNPAWLPGGFSGVDMFFCISGFVNTASLIHGKGGAKGVCDFYGRRMWRIAPALMVNVLVTGVAMGVFLPPDLTALMSYFISGFFGLVGVVNNYFASMKLDYFETGHKDLAMNPFTHLWSLGVEEQFYFLFPLFIGSTERWRVAMATLAVFTIASAWAGAVWTDSNGQLGFYTLPCRFWELALGAFAFHLVQAGPSKVTQLLCQILAAVCLPCALLFTRSRPGFPWPWASLSVGGAACFMIAGSEPDSLLNKCLGNMAAVYIGRLSYSLYLWHWPVFVFYRYTIGLDSGGCRLAALAITTALSMATYHLFEKPLARNRPKQTWNICTRIVAFLSITALALLALAFPLRGVLYVGSLERETPSIPVRPNIIFPDQSASHLPNETKETKETNETKTPEAWELCPGPGQWSRRRDVRWVPENPSTCSMEYTWQDSDNPKHYEIVLIGDSTMAHMVVHLEDFACSGGLTLLRKGERCTTMEFMGIERSPVWNKPTRRQGPLDWAKDHPFCQDCEGCEARQIRCNMHDANGHTRTANVEYIGIEFAQDVELQSVESNTSQGVVGEYLCRKEHPATVLITDGAHHFWGHGDFPSDVYVEYWRSFIKHLKKCAKEIVWMPVNQVTNDEKYKVVRANEAAYKLLLEEHPDIFTLDTFKMSQLTAMHDDVYHMNRDYYRVLQQILFSFATWEG